MKEPWVVDAGEFRVIVQAADLMEARELGKEAARAAGLPVVGVHFFGVPAKHMTWWRAEMEEAA